MSGHLIVQSYSRFDVVAGNPLMRIAIGAVAIALLVIAGILFFGVVRSRLGRGVARTRSDLERIAEEQHYGDLAQAAAALRSVFPLSLALISGSTWCLGISLHGSEYGSSEWIGVGYMLAFSGIWYVSARELGFPRFLQPPGAKGVPGLLVSRIESRHRRHDRSGD